MSQSPTSDDPRPLRPKGSAARESLTGSCLVAMPGMDDPTFMRAVVYMCLHNDEQAMGLRLNAPIPNLSAHELFRQLGLATDEDESFEGDLRLVNGGPVEPERGFVLHTPDYFLTEASARLDADVALTSTRTVLEDLAHGGGPKSSILALGYAAWGPGQLENELKHNIWLTVTPDLDLIFRTPPEKMWQKAITRLGFTPDHLSGQAGHA